MFVFRLYLPTEVGQIWQEDQLFANSGSTLSRSHVWFLFMAVLLCLTSHWSSPVISSGNLLNDTEGQGYKHTFENILMKIALGERAIQHFPGYVEH